MSPKPVDLRRALNTLRQERPTPEQTERLLAHLDSLPLGRGGVSPRHRPFARPLAFAMMTAALALALVFPPRTTAGSAWAQTVANTLAAPNVHLVSRWPNGRVASEEWRSGSKRATVLRRQDGRVLTELRNDGRRTMAFSSTIGYTEWRGEKPGPNAREWALVGPDFHTGSFYEIPLGDAKVALSDPDIRVLEHREASGTVPETYRLHQTLRIQGRPLDVRHDFNVEIDPASGRVRAIVEDPRDVGGKSVVARTEIDYPERVPAATFEPRPQAAKGVEVYDNPAIQERLQRGIRNGIAKQGPVVLRAVLVDGGGDLWAFWTGALPDPKLRRPFSAPGVRLGSAFTNKAYTTAWRESPKMNGVPKPTKGPRIGGMGRTTLSKLGPTVDLGIPYPGGVARFRNVPYVRVGYVSHFSGTLGAPRDYR